MSDTTTTTGNPSTIQSEQAGTETFMNLMHSVGQDPVAKKNVYSLLVTAREAAKTNDVSSMFGLANQSDSETLQKRFKRVFDWAIEDKRADVLAALLKGYTINGVEYKVDLNGLDYKVDLNGLDQKKLRTAFLLVAGAGEIDAVQAMLDCNAVNSKAIKQGFLLAANEGRIEVVKALIESKRVSLSCQSDEGLTALMVAARNGHADVVSALLDTPQGKAMVNLQDDKGMTSLMHAVESGHSDIVTSLLKAGADLTITNNDGKTAENLAENNESAKAAITAYQKEVEIQKKAEVERKEQEVLARIDEARADEQNKAQAQIDSLTAENNSLTAENNSLRGQVDKLNQEVSNLNNSVRNLEAGLAALEERLKSASNATSLEPLTSEETDNGKDNSGAGNPTKQNQDASSTNGTQEQPVVPVNTASGENKVVSAETSSNQSLVDGGTGKQPQSGTDDPAVPAQKEQTQPEGKYTNKRRQFESKSGRGDHEAIMERAKKHNSKDIRKKGKHSNGSFRSNDEYERALATIQKMEDEGLLPTGPNGESNAEFYLWKLRLVLKYAIGEEDLKTSDLQRAGAQAIDGKYLSTPQLGTPAAVFDALCTGKYQDEHLEDIAQVLMNTERLTTAYGNKSRPYVKGRGTKTSVQCVKDEEVKDEEVKDSSLQTTLRTSESVSAVVHHGGLKDKLGSSYVDDATENHVLGQGMGTGHIV